MLWKSPVWVIETCFYFLNMWPCSRLCSCRHSVMRIPQVLFWPREHKFYESSLSLWIFSYFMRPFSRYANYSCGAYYKPYSSISYLHFFSKLWKTRSYIVTFKNSSRVKKQIDDKGRKADWWSKTIDWLLIVTNKIAFLIFINSWRVFFILRGGGIRRTNK